MRDLGCAVHPDWRCAMGTKNRFDDTHSFRAH